LTFACLVNRIYPQNQIAYDIGIAEIQIYFLIYQNSNSSYRCVLLQRISWIS